MKTYEEMNHEHDEKFAKSDQINFYPFVGKNYKTASPKILVLGESHYYPEVKEGVATREEQNNNHNFTRLIFVEEYLRGFHPDGTHEYPRIKTYSNTVAVITGKGYKQSDDIWESMAFYNFFQKIVGNTSNDKQFITPELIENSQKAYFEVLRILKPALVIAWGKSDLKNKWAPQPEKTIDGELLLFGYNEFPDTAIWYIHHPSIGFSYEEHQAKFETVLNKLGLDISKLR